MAGRVGPRVRLCIVMKLEGEMELEVEVEVEDEDEAGRVWVVRWKGAVEVEVEVVVESCIDWWMGFVVVVATLGLVLVLVLVLVLRGEGDLGWDREIVGEGGDGDGGVSGKPRPGRQVWVAMMPILRYWPLLLLLLR
jgi:hypothetical protein